MKKLVNIHTLLLFMLLVVAASAARAQIWSLQQCIDTAQVSNKNLQIQQNNQALSEQKHLEARANLIPKLTANADYKYYLNLPYQLLPASTFGGPVGTFKEAQFGVAHNINANLQLSVPLYNPQLLGAVRATEIATELSSLQYQKTAEQVYFDIANLYYNAQILQHQLHFIDSNLLNTNKLLQTTQLLKSQLLAKGTDVQKIQLQVAQLNTQKELVNSKYEQVLNALKFAMGLDINRKIAIDPDIVHTKERNYNNLSPIDVRLAKVQNKLLANELHTLKKSRLPSVSLLAAYGTTGYGYDKSPNEFLKFFPLSFGALQLTYPIFSGSSLQRRINQKNIELQNIALQIDIATEQNNMLIDNAKRQRNVMQSSIATMLKQIELAQSIYQQTVLQQKQGTATLIDILLADNALREAQQNYLSTIIDYLKADLELKKLSGNISSKY